MRLLDRYLLRELLIPLSYCLGGFLIFWISFDLFSELDTFHSRRLTGTDIAHYYLAGLPEMLSTGLVLPMALLLALLYALTNHARHHELTAMRAAGVGLWRVAAPYLAVGLVFSLLSAAMEEFWVPKSREKAREILARREVAPREQAGWQSNLYFRNEMDNRFWSAAAYHLRTLELSKVNVRWNLADGGWRDLYAERASWTNGTWHFFEAQEWRYRSASDAMPDPPVQSSLMLKPDFQESPELIRSELKINQLSGKEAAKRPQLTTREILNYLRLHPRPAPRQKALLDTQLHGRLAAPWTCLMVVLIALPFGAPSGRRNVFVGVAASLFICFAYFILLRVGLTLGTGGRLPGWLAAWLPNILFGLAGIILTTRVR